MTKVLMAAVLLVALVVTPALAGPGPDFIVGTAGDDVLTGGTAPDDIYGLEGDDSIWGQKAPDILRGGKGDDDLHGIGSGEAPDTLLGGPGNDKCVGTANDTFQSCEVIIVL